MKKILFCFLWVTLLFSCKEDDYFAPTYPILDQAKQNDYDDKAIKNYLENTYITDRGKITSSKTDVNNDEIENRKLADLNPITLPSGVVYIMIPDAQPEDGITLGADDYLSFQQVGFAMRAVETDGEIKFANEVSFNNTIDGSGIPLNDPMWYHVPQSVLDKAKENNSTEGDEARTQRSYYEIEGFQEAILKFKSFDLPNEANYNMQGIIIVPSRAAFGKDPHYNYVGIGLNDFSFVFNFQLYRAHPRTEAEK